MANPLVEFRVREDLIAAARRASADHDVTVSSVVATAVADFLAAGSPMPVMTGAKRARLAVRLPSDLVSAVRVFARAQGVSPRLVVEAALARRFAPARGAGWDPNRSAER